MAHFKMKSELRILTTLFFLSGLCILLLNDLVLKDLYGNWLTGKLSDFAGLLIFPLFWTAIFPRHKIIIFWLTGLLFIIWKSPYSQNLIDLWNSMSPYTISRVVDYTDLISLTILPLSFKIEAQKEKLLNIRLAPIIPLALSTFAFIATSEGPKTCFSDNPAIYHVKHYSRDSFVRDLKNVGFNISFTEYHNTKFVDEHSEIHNVNDSIENLVVLIKDFNKADSTVEITLGCWRLKNNSTAKNLDEKSLETQRVYVKSVFENEVLKKVEKNVP